MSYLKLNVIADKKSIDLLAAQIVDAEGGDIEEILDLKVTDLKGNSELDALLLICEKFYIPPIPSSPIKFAYFRPTHLKLKFIYQSLTSEQYDAVMTLVNKYHKTTYSDSNSITTEDTKTIILEIEGDVGVVYDFYSNLLNFDFIKNPDHDELIYSY